MKDFKTFYDENLKECKVIARINDDDSVELSLEGTHAGLIVMLASCYEQSKEFHQIIKDSMHLYEQYNALNN